MICPRCKCSILAVHKDMDCHGHNDKLVWTREFDKTKEIFVVSRKHKQEKDKE